MPTLENIRPVAPAVEKYAKDILLGDLRERRGFRRATAAW
jgi:hypothetical protein